MKAITEQELLDAVSEDVRTIIASEKISLNSLSALSKVSLWPLKQLKKGHSISLSNLLKITNSLGYEITFAKKKLKKEITNDPEAAIILSTLKEKQLHAKRKERGQPTSGHLPTRITVKKYASDDGRLIALSRRDISAQHKQDEDDIFGLAGVSNEVP